MIKRPPSVWITQFLVGMAGALMVVGTYRWTRLILAGVDQGMAINPFWLYLEGACRVVLLVLFAATFWSIARARPAGRWLGVGSLTAIFAVVVWANYLRTAGTPAFVYDNSAQEGGAFILKALLAAAFLTLICRFGFSRASRAYFAGADTRKERPELK